MRSVSPIILLCMIGCRSIPPPINDVVTIRSSNVYTKLTKNEIKLADKIMVLALKSNKKDYYFRKLRLLLNTPYFEKKSKVKSIENADRRDKKEIRVRRASKSPVELERYLNIEEDFEKSYSGKWYKECDSPYGEGKCFYTTKDPLNVLIRINISVSGNRNDIIDIVDMEDAAEKHLSIPGFSVNLVFYPAKKKGFDVFEITIDRKIWPNSSNWSTGYKTMAHEAMHLFGLEDEYDRIEEHADNKYLTIHKRLELFLKQMKLPLSVTNIKSGIMYNSSRKPLDRHACLAANLGDDCVKKRMRYFHGKRK